MGSKSRRRPLLRRRGVRAVLGCVAAFALLELGLRLRGGGGGGDDGGAPLRPYARVATHEVAAPHEKRQAAGGRRDWKVGSSWGGQWRAASEPGGARAAGAGIETRLVEDDAGAPTPRA